MPADDAPYEPWRPLPGQRVRVRRSLECPSAHHIRDATLDDGRMGTVGAMRPPWEPEHPYPVLFDDPVPTGITWPPSIRSSRYAAAELEPVDAR